MTNFSEYAKRLVPDEVKLAMFSQKPPMWTGTQEEWEQKEKEDEAKAAQIRAENEAKLNKKMHEEGFGNLATDGTGINTIDNIVNRAVNPKVQKMADESLNRDADAKLSKYMEDPYNKNAVDRVIKSKVDAAGKVHESSKAAAVKDAEEKAKREYELQLKKLQEEHDKSMKDAKDESYNRGKQEGYSYADQRDVIHNEIEKKLIESGDKRAAKSAKVGAALGIGGTALAGLGIYGLYKLIKKLRSKPNKTPDEVATLQEATKQYQAKKANFSKLIK